jgi:predicted RNase H-like nuclease (RuvC/YqgF family)
VVVGFVKSSFADQTNLNFHHFGIAAADFNRLISHSHPESHTEQNPMANILGIFTAIILAVATWVAVKNNERFKSEIANRATEEASLALSQDRLKAALEVLRALPIERAAVDAEFAAKTEEETGLKDANAALKSEIERKTDQIAANKRQLDEFREKTAKVGNIRDLEGKMKTMRTELQELIQSIDDNEVSLANLTAENTSTQADADRRKTELETFSRGESLPSLKTSLRNIYPTWGFVTLNAGNNAGVTTNSTLDVIRDGETIAKLLVTAVESQSASASIIPDSLAEDVTLMVGDRVVASSKDKKPAGN